MWILLTALVYVSCIRRQLRLIVKESPIDHQSSSKVSIRGRVASTDQTEDDHDDQTETADDRIRVSQEEVLAANP